MQYLFCVWLSKTSHVHLVFVDRRHVKHVKSCFIQIYYLRKDKLKLHVHFFVNTCVLSKSGSGHKPIISKWDFIELNQITCNNFALRCLVLFAALLLMALCLADTKLINVRPDAVVGRLLRDLGDSDSSYTITIKQIVSESATDRVSVFSCTKLEFCVNPA